MSDLLKHHAASVPNGLTCPARRFRDHLTAFVLTTLALLVGTESTLQAEGESKKLRSVTDSWPIHITYFPAFAKDSNQAGGGELGSPDAGVVILLHGKGGDRLVWERKHGKAKFSFVEGLQKLRFAVVTVDMRKHGESKSPNGAQDDAVLRNEDYQNMWRGDLEAVKQFLMEQHQEKKLNVNKLAIVAADDMAPIAARFAVFDWNKPPYDDAPATSPEARTRRGQDVRALVFLSPSNTAGNVGVMGPVKSLRDPNAAIAMLVVVGEDDRLDGGTARNIHRVVSAKDQDKTRTYLQTYERLKFRGTDLLSNVNTLDVMAQFLDNHVQQLNSPWQDRRSRLDR